LREEETAAKERALNSSRLEDQRKRDEDNRAREADLATRERSDEAKARKTENESMIGGIGTII